MAEDLASLIQKHTSSNVTPNFVKTLTNLAKVHAHDVGKFTTASMALGKFKGQERFLSDLHRQLNSTSVSGEILRDSAGLYHDPINIRPKQPVNRQPRSTKARRKPGILNLDFEEDEQSSQENETSNLALEKTSASQTTPSFKKISKDKAGRLKKFSEDAGSGSTNFIKKNASEVALPSMVSFAHQDLNAAPLEVEADPTNGSDVYLSEEEDPQALDEDRDWYNHDDDYGNQAAEILPDDLAFPSYRNRDDGRHKEREDVSDIKSQIHLSAMALNQRKTVIPPFLLKYTKDSTVLANIGTIGGTQDSSQRRLIDPIRNPESDFSLNCRKGSHLVAERRSREVHKTKIEETLDLRGTAIGKVLGVKHENQSRETSDNNAVTTVTETSPEQIKKTRRSLPAFQVRSKLLQVVNDNQVVVIIGETGSGKTTQLAQYLNEEGYCEGGKLIGCTQPRRVAAMSVASRVAVEMGVKLGEEVGYTIRFEDRTSARTKVKFMTDGILLRETLMSKMLDKYSCIIMDEAHERSLNTDILFGIFKTLLARRRDLKLIITSATMNANKFSQFFGSAPQFTIPGRTFPVQTIFTRHPVSDYVDSAILQACKIHLSTPITDGDILIFMTGQEDIEATCEGLREKLADVHANRTEKKTTTVLDDIEILPIYSALPADVQGKIFNSTPNKRKVVVATNIAETSLTVDGIRYVIDCGYSKIKVYSPQIGLDSLQIAPISMASANQRSGRAGRTGPGIAYRLYTEDSYFEDMYVQTIPEIQRTNLSNTLLLLKYLGVDDIMKFPFVDPPPEQIILVSLFELWTIGALDNFGALTELGREMAAFPLQPPLSKMLLVASKNGCSEEILTIVSMLSVPQVFYRPKERQEESDQARSRFFVPESDHLTLLNVYSQWKANNYSSTWCRRNFLQAKSLQRARSIRTQLRVLMEKKKTPIVSSGTDWDIVRKCICCGYAQQAAKLSGLSRYTHLRSGLELRIHPTSALYGAGDLPSYVIYHEMLLTTNEYINTVTAVDPFWLMEYGVLFYDVKRRVEDVGQGIYAEESPKRPEDSIDLSIKRCTMKREIIQRQIQKDTKIVIESMSDYNNMNKRPKKQVSSAVNIGFKRRRPL